MPKIIENLERKLLEEAKRQIQEDGYGAMTIRSVAAACGVGVGTVYNYFPSKDTLAAACMLEDWSGCIAAIAHSAESAVSPEPVVHCIYDQLCLYSQRHQKLFREEAAVAAFSGSVSRYHAQLRDQLAEPLRRFCDSSFTSKFIAEALLTWTMAGKSFEEIYAIIGKLF